MFSTVRTKSLLCVVSKFTNEIIEPNIDVVDMNYEQYYYWAQERGPAGGGGFGFPLRSNAVNYYSGVCCTTDFWFIRVLYRQYWVVWFYELVYGVEFCQKLTESQDLLCPAILFRHNILRRGCHGRPVCSINLICCYWSHVVNLWLTNDSQGNHQLCLILLSSSLPATEVRIMAGTALR